MFNEDYQSDTNWNCNNTKYQAERHQAERHQASLSWCCEASTGALNLSQVRQDSAKMQKNWTELEMTGGLQGQPAQTNKYVYTHIWVYICVCVCILNSEQDMLFIANLYNRWLIVISVWNLLEINMWQTCRKFCVCMHVTHFVGTVCVYTVSM